MPTILRFRGFLIGIWFNDHPPAHVHARKGRDFAVFDLGCDGGPISLRDSRGVSNADVTALRQKIEENRDILCKAWRDWHDDR